MSRGNRNKVNNILKEGRLVFHCTVAWFLDLEGKSVQIIKCNSN